jgi:hypothetical protein
MVEREKKEWGIRLVLKPLTDRPDDRLNSRIRRILGGGLFFDQDLGIRLPRHGLEGLRSFLRKPALKGLSGAIA